MARLFISQNLLDEIIDHCKELYPYEACGILAGKDNVVWRVFRTTNIEKSGVSYFMDPGEQFAAMKEIRAGGLEMTAIYHSHPSSDAYPSPRDVSLAFYEDSFYLIVSLIHEEPVLRAFEIKKGSVRETELIVVNPVNPDYP